MLRQNVFGISHSRALFNLANHFATHAAKIGQKRIAIAQEFFKLQDLGRKGPKFSLPIGLQVSCFSIRADITPKNKTKREQIKNKGKFRGKMLEKFKFNGS